MSNVPQFVDIEDHIVGPLTARQLGWLALGGVILLVLWGLLALPAFIVSAVFVAIIFGGLAFYRPYNQPLINFVLSSVGFLFKPKMYVWKRLPDREAAKKAPVKEEISVIQKKEVNEQKVEEISKLLDVK